MEEKRLLQPDCLSSPVAPVCYSGSRFRMNSRILSSIPARNSTPVTNSNIFELPIMNVSHCKWVTLPIKGNLMYDVAMTQASINEPAHTMTMPNHITILQNAITIVMQAFTATRNGFGFSTKAAITHSSTSVHFRPNT